MVAGGFLAAAVAELTSQLVNAADSAIDFPHFDGVEMLGSSTKPRQDHRGVGFVQGAEHFLGRRQPQQLAAGRDGARESNDFFPLRVGYGDDGTFKRGGAVTVGCGFDRLALGTFERGTVGRAASVDGQGVAHVRV